MEFPKRFMDKVEILENGCWNWASYMTREGYGRFRSGGKYQLAHRWAWKFANQQEIPKGLEVSHICHNVSCVYPGHLVAETGSENRARGRSIDFALRTHCRNGLHELTPENIFIDSNGKQLCHACRKATNRKTMRNLRQKAKSDAIGLEASAT